MAPLRPIVTPELVWPDAWRGDVAGVVVVVGDIGRLESVLPPPSAADFADVGRRDGEQRRLFLQRRGVLRILAARQLGLAVDDVPIAYDPRGAPVVRPSAPLSVQTSCFVSVAARERIAGFALAETAVGIDLEPLADPGSVAAVLSEPERRAVAAVPENARAEAVLRLWTAKEAHLKRSGLGLRIDPAEIGVEPLGEDAFALWKNAPDARHGLLGQGRWLSLNCCGARLVVAVVCDEG